MERVLLPLSTNVVLVLVLVLESLGRIYKDAIVANVLRSTLIMLNKLHVSETVYKIVSERLKTFLEGWLFFRCNRCAHIILNTVLVSGGFCSLELVPFFQGFSFDAIVVHIFGGPL